jgi:hypothetical protein
MDYFTRSPGLVPLPRQTASDASQQKLCFHPSPGQTKYKSLSRQLQPDIYSTRSSKVR